MFRRTFAALTVLAATFTMSFAAQAADATQARQYVDSLGTKVLEVVNSQGAEADRQAKLRQMFGNHVDIDWMGQFVLGPTWRQSNDDQKRRYLNAYREYLLARYTRNFADYAGSKYTITDVRAISDGQFEVGMQINATGGQKQDIVAGYRLSSTGAQFHIIDIIIEGVSLTTTERSEFASVLQQNGIEGLIGSLQSKTSPQEK